MYKKATNLNEKRKLNHENYLIRNWQNKNIIFNNPDIPLKYQTNGLTCSPHSTIKIPLIITGSVSVQSQ